MWRKKPFVVLILDDKIRLDGRKTDEIRPIWSEVDYLPSAHGSAVFTRGETQSITTVTLGTKMDAKLIDDVLKKGNDKFLLHYNFPAFSTGDAQTKQGNKPQGSRTRKPGTQGTEGNTSFSRRDALYTQNCI